VPALDGHHIRALAANGRQILAVSGANGQGLLWQSIDGIDWKMAQQFTDAQPVDVTLFMDHIYVGAIGADGKGVLFGPPYPTTIQPNATSADALPYPADRIPASDVPAAFERLDAALADPTSYGHQLPSLFENLAALRTPDAGAGFADRLDTDFPDSTVSLFGGAVEVPAALIGRWSLLNAIARNGHGNIMPALLQGSWQAAPNRAEKYLETAPAAAWVVSRTGQRDDDLIDTLVIRLGQTDDPQWLKGDFIGALSALTGERFGYDIPAWQDWWAAQTLN